MLGCGSDDDTGGESPFDCTRTCDRYRACFDATYDVNACSQRCIAAQASTPGFADQANKCDVCLNQQETCSASFDCASDCRDLVP
jgi:hypothetical protein